MRIASRGRLSPDPSASWLVRKGVTQDLKRDDSLCEEFSVAQVGEHLPDANKPHFC